MRVRASMFSLTHTLLAPGGDIEGSRSLRVARVGEVRTHGIAHIVALRNALSAVGDVSDQVGRAVECGRGRVEVEGGQGGCSRCVALC